MFKLKSIYAIILFFMLQISAYSLADTCKAILSESSNTKSSLHVITESNAYELLFALESASIEQRQSLYSVLAQVDIIKLAKSLHAGEIPKGLVSFMEEIDGSSQFLYDLIAVGEAFPGIFGQPKVDEILMKTLRSIHQIEMKEGMGKGELFASVTMGSRLKLSLRSTLANLVEQGDLEYQGSRFEQGPWQFRWYKFKRWFHPTFYKTRAIINFLQMYERHVGRLQKKQRLLAEVLNPLLDKGGYEDFVEEVINELRNDPQELIDLGKDVESIIGSGFGTNTVAELGTFQITEIYKRIKNISEDAIEASFSAKTLAIIKLRKKAREILEGKELKPKDYKTITLRLAFEARHQRVEYFRDQYYSITSTRSKERYSVERRRTRQVRTGTDSKGNATYRTETYYVSDTVYPRMENILSGSYDTGDRSVSGLSSIKNRAKAMVAKERPVRNLLNETIDFYRKVLDGYQESVTTGEKKDFYLNGMRGEFIPRLNRMIEYQKRYMVKPSLYSRDIAKNHRTRNQKILERLINMRNQLKVLSALLERNELRLNPVYDMYDFSGRLGYQSSRRVRTHVEQSVLGGVVFGGGGSYVLSPEVQDFVDNHLDTFIQLLQSSF